ncbi:MAG: hypothetical protein ABWY25_07410 [Paenisporosarcina sp.]
MSYETISKCAKDSAFVARVTACAAKEGVTLPETSLMWVIWPISSAGDIESAYASALAADNPNPGGDESVITDNMILSAFQANWPPPEQATIPQ